MKKNCTKSVKYTLQTARNVLFYMQVKERIGSMKRKQRKWLYKIRKKMKFNFAEMAKYLEIPLTTYRSYELGDRNPTVVQAKGLAEKLNIEWTIFFEK